MSTLEAVEVVAPQRLKMSYEEYLEYTGDSQLVEWVDGEIIPAPLDESGIYHSNVLPNFWFDASWLWQQELPNPQLILAKIMISIPGLSPEVKETYQALHKLLSK
jgi:hypothetical protein